MVILWGWVFLMSEAPLYTLGSIPQYPWVLGALTPGLSNPNRTPLPTLNSELQTLNPEPRTLNPKP